MPDEKELLYCPGLYSARTSPTSSRGLQSHRRWQTSRWAAAAVHKGALSNGVLARKAHVQLQQVTVPIWLEHEPPWGNCLIFSQIGDYICCTNVCFWLGRHRVFGSRTDLSLDFYAVRWDCEGQCEGTGLPSDGLLEYGIAFYAEPLPGPCTPHIISMQWDVSGQQRLLSSYHWLSPVLGFSPEDQMTHLQRSLWQYNLDFLYDSAELSNWFGAHFLSSLNQTDNMLLGFVNERFVEQMS